MTDHDRRLMAPYQAAADATERLECPDCGEPMTEDPIERCVLCPECGYSDGWDWGVDEERGVL